MNANFRSLASLAVLMLSVALSAGCGKKPASSGDGAARSSGTSGDSGSSAGSSMSGGAESSRAQESGASSSGSSAVGDAARATGTAATDTVTTGKVKAALLADSDLKSMGISVDTNAGEVTLTGTVNNQTQIDRAVQVASAVSGVNSVRNRLAIKR